MVTLGAVNLLRMEPRLAPASGERQRLLQTALAHLRRNAIAEAGLGLCVIGIVAALGMLPPRLHTEPGWPMAFRLEPAALSTPAAILLALLTLLAAAFTVAAVGTAAAGNYRATTIATGGLAICAAFGVFVARPAIEAAYPTSFWEPTQPYAATSVVRGARFYAENCALCHGAGGKGDGPAAATLSVCPANLTEPHLFAHSEGDLYWWVSHGKANGVMPGFENVMSPSDRWDVINFIRARAAGILSRSVGSDISATAGPAVPDFAFETGEQQQVLSRMLQGGPALAGRRHPRCYRRAGALQGAR